MESFDLAKRSITHLEHVNRMVEMFVYIHTFFTGNLDCLVYYILEFPISRIAHRITKFAWTPVFFPVIIHFPNFFECRTHVRHIILIHIFTVSFVLTFYNIE